MRWLVLVCSLGVAACVVGSRTAPNDLGVAPSPPPDDEIAAAVQHNLDVLNGHRAEAGVAPLVLDDVLSSHALRASKALAAGGRPHEYLQTHRDEIRAAVGAQLLFENQGRRGGGRSDVGRMEMIERHIDWIVGGMMDEGPGGAHHDVIVNPALRRVGIGIVVDGRRLILTNDFTD